MNLIFCRIFRGLQQYYFILPFFKNVPFLDVFDTKRRIWGYLMVLGWGFPLPFVIAAIAVNQAGTSTYDTECFSFSIPWLLFLGPMYFVIIVNILLFIVIIFRLCQVKCKRNNRTHRNETIVFVREFLVESILMTFVLGLPWVVWTINLANFLTTSFNGGNVSNDNSKHLSWLIGLYGIPGLALLVIVVLKYRDLSKKKAAYISNNNQANSENAAEAVRRALPKPKPKPRHKLFTIRQGSILSSSVGSTRDRTDSFLSWKLKKLRTSLSIKLHAYSDKDNSINEVHTNVEISADDHQTVNSLH